VTFRRCWSDPLTSRVSSRKSDGAHRRPHKSRLADQGLRLRRHGWLWLQQQWRVRQAACNKHPCNRLTILCAKPLLKTSTLFSMPCCSCQDFQHVSCDPEAVRVEGLHIHLTEGTAERSLEALPGRARQTCTRGRRLRSRPRRSALARKIRLSGSASSPQNTSPTRISRKGERSF